MNGIKRWWVSVALVLAGALLVGACGDGDGADADVHVDDDDSPAAENS